MLKKISHNLKSKEGTEILQTLIIIAIIGAVSITIVATFRNTLYGAAGRQLGLKTEFSEHDTSLGSKMINFDTRYDNKNKITYNQ